MMLRPVNISAGRLDPERMRVYDSALQYQDRNGTATLSLEGRRLVSASCWWDPAYGAPGKGDGSVVALVFTDTQSRYWLHRLRYLGVDTRPTSATKQPSNAARSPHSRAAITCHR